jgi:hypothetical protein
MLFNAEMTAGNICYGNQTISSSAALIEVPVHQEVSSSRPTETGELNGGGGDDDDNDDAIRFTFNKEKFFAGSFFPTNICKNP